MSAYLGKENVLASNVSVIYISIKIILNCRKYMNYVKKIPNPKATEQISVKLSNILISKLERKR